MAVSKGNPLAALTLAQNQYPNDTNLLGTIKSAVVAGTLDDADWAAPLSAARALGDEFLEAARPSSILLRLTGLRKIPFQTRVPRVTASSIAGWVGEGASKPVSEMRLDDVTMDPTKCAGIVVISLELARSSAPNAESVIRADLIGSVNLLVDATFVGTAAATSWSPAGILNGVTPVTSTGTSASAIAADVATVISGMTTAGGEAAQLLLLMHPSTSAKVGLVFATVGAQVPLPILTSTAVTAGRLIVIDQTEVLLADDNVVAIDATGQAALQLDSAPSTPAAALTSLWQQNLFAIRAERLVNWAPRKTAAATAGYISGIA